MKSKFYKVKAETANGEQFEYADAGTKKSDITVNVNSNISKKYGDYKILSVKVYKI